jgi:glucose-1-phosphate thymidylyltransferase
VNALILAAGYATRLYPLTLHRAKPLLPVGGRPMVDHLLERMNAVPGLRSIHLVTNGKFAPAFRAWAEHKNVTVHDDGTRSEDDRLGAIGDIRWATEEAGLEGDDLLVVAGDNLFDFSLADYVDWWRGKDEASAIALHDCGDLELAKKYATVELDEDERVVGFVEKPPEPQSTLVSTATYLYHGEHVPLVGRYLEEGNSPDAPGNFIAWLHRRAPVYGYRFEGGWMDIGGPEELLEADNRLRARAGLPEREIYSLD